MRFILVSTLLHLMLLFGVGWLISSQVEYSMVAGQNSIEVDLVAAPAQAQPSASDPEAFPMVPPPELPPDLSEPQDFQIETPPNIPPPPAPPRIKAPLNKTKSSPVVGDGSAPIPGRDATTQRSQSGTESLAKPNYLRNPAPPYPETARRAGQEGVVLIKVRVNARGMAEEVALLKSSGFQALDDSALRTVKNWRFHPARLGSVAISSDVSIPIRFQLN
ncbi:MAG: energy transducer TonB [Blastochloris sp.]|nr:energy transducer TonB [Blastochloris sp.]